MWLGVHLKSCYWLAAACSVSTLGPSLTTPLPTSLLPSFLPFSHPLPLFNSSSLLLSITQCHHYLLIHRHFALIYQEVSHACFWLTKCMQTQSYLKPQRLTSPNTCMLLNTTRLTPIYMMEIQTYKLLSQTCVSVKREVTKTMRKECSHTRHVTFRCQIFLSFQQFSASRGKY